jgi:hypothetical protein
MKPTLLMAHLHLVDKEQQVCYFIKPKMRDAGCPTHQLNITPSKTYKHGVQFSFRHAMLVPYWYFSSTKFPTLWFG